MSFQENREFEMASNMIISEQVCVELDGVPAIVMRKSDGYVDATIMCQASGKLLGHWKSLNSTDEFLKELSSSIAIAIVELIKQQDGGNGERHTWAHPDVAIELARWCSVKFRVATAQLLRRFYSGQVTTDESIRAARALMEASLPPAEVRMANFITAMEKVKLLDNPRVKTIVSDLAVNVALNTKWRGVVEIAEILGFTQAAYAKYRTALGKYVKKHASDGVEFKKEERLVNGTIRPVFVYKDTDEVRTLIKDFFRIISA